MSETSIYVVLTLITLATALAALLYAMQRRSASRSSRAALASRFAGKPADEGFVEQQTRFVETTRKKTYRLLNVSEQALYLRLEEAMPNMRVFAQVGIMQLAQLRGRVAAGEAQLMLGRSVDFLVCDKNFAIVAAIELSWPTDENTARQKAAETKRIVLEKLAIPLIYFKPNQIPDIDEIARAIAEAVVSRKQLEAARDRALESGGNDAR